MKKIVITGIFPKW